MRSTYNTAPERGCIVRQSLSKFYLRQLTEGGRLPEREPSQLVLDQVLIQACKISTIYTQFQPIMLQF